jgi:hypothetical protein
MTNQTKLRTPAAVTNTAIEASTVPEIVKRTLEQSLRLLDVAKAEYIIRLGDGTMLTKGKMELVTPRKTVKYTKKPRKMPYGTMRNWVAPQIAHLHIGDVAELDLSAEMQAAGVDLRDLMSSVSSTANKLFGLDSHKVCTNKKTGKIEILRTA